MQFNAIPVFSAVIPGRVGIKKNSRMIAKIKGRTINIPSKSYKAWEMGALFHLKQKRLRCDSTILGECMAEYTFHFKNRSGEADVSNCIEGPQDCLQAAGIIKNDKQIIELYARKIFDGTEKTVIVLYEKVSL